STTTVRRPLRNRGRLRSCCWPHRRGRAPPVGRPWLPASVAGPVAYWDPSPAGTSAAHRTLRRVPALPAPSPALAAGRPPTPATARRVRQESRNGRQLLPLA